MIELRLDEQNKLRSLFAAFEDNNIPYVIPRGYKNLPSLVDGGDVDILVSPTGFSRAISICKESGFQAKRLDSMLAMQARKVIANPKKVIPLILTSPKKVTRAFSNHVCLGSSEKISSNYLDAKLYFNNIMVHLFNNLAYKSPSTGAKIMVDPKINQYMFERAERYNFFYVPSPPDELVHLVCRGVFDYSGKFPDYYLNKCESLANEILPSEQQNQRLQELLKLTFFKADSIVYEHIAKNQYTHLRSNLLKFSQY